MTFLFSKENLAASDRRLQRLFEIIPGAVSWTILLGLAALTVTRPILASVLIIAFLFYWVLRLFYQTILLMFSYGRLTVESQTDWQERISGLDRLETYLKRVRSQRSFGPPARRLSHWFHRKDLEALAASGSKPPLSSDIFHLVIIPAVKESREIVEANVQSIAKSKFPQKRILVLIACEARAEEKVREGCSGIAAKYREQFLDCEVVEHPDAVEGEARVKGANATYAARHAARFFEERGIPFENILVSCFDADTQASPDYFSCLTYSFMCRPDRTRCSFQPIPVYHNNIWKVPGFARVIETGSSFFQLIEATNPEKLVTFSSHSMSFKALVEAGYWPVDMISDDSAIFWKAYLHFDGKYCVVPLYATLSMDVVDAGSWVRTVLSIYKQKRRWAWGVENFPIVARGFLTHGNIPWKDKVRHLSKMFEGHVTWATLPFLLMVASWLPLIFSGREFSSTVLYFNARRVMEITYTLSGFALLGSIFVSQCLLPRSYIRYSLVRRTIHALEWLLVPFILVFLSAAPALDAQTRLLFGRYMEFRVSEKRRKS
ncbi:MAG: glycosyltransferase family 2 protein [Candidatus Omnitrophota bacterium]